MDFLLILVLTLLNGAFAMSELALTASRKVRLQTMADTGDSGAQAALRLLDHPTQFLSVVQVGITGIGMLNAGVGEAAFGDGLARWLRDAFALAPKVAGITSTVLVVTVITFITILFGELVPKRIGQLHPEPVARVVARPMVWIASVAKPFVQLLSLCTHGILQLMGVNTANNRGVTHAEISASLEEGVDAGIIEENEHQMVRNVFRLDDRPLPSMMLPRSDIDWLDADYTVATALQHASGATGRTPHSWYPVCRGSLDDVVGVVSVARLLERGVRYPFGVGALVEPEVYCSRQGAPGAGATLCHAWTSASASWSGLIHCKVSMPGAMALPAASCAGSHSRLALSVMAYFAPQSAIMPSSRSGLRRRGG